MPISTWSIALALTVGLPQTPAVQSDGPTSAQQVAADREVKGLRRTAADLRCADIKDLESSCQRKRQLITKAEKLAYENELPVWQRLLDERTALVDTIERLRKAQADVAAGGAKAKAQQVQAETAATEGIRARSRGDCATAVTQLEAANQLWPGNPEAASNRRYLADAKRCVDRAVAVWRWATRLGTLACIGLLGAVVLRFKLRRRRLEMVEGPERGRVFKLEKDRVTLGAVAEEADWVIADPYRKLSRRHCEIARSGRHFFVVDLSRNGTFLNGRALPKDEPVLLRKNDELTLADEIVLIFR